MSGTTALAHIYQPIDVGGLRLRNRLVLTTHGPRLAQARYLRYLDARSHDVALVGLHAGYGMGGFPLAPGAPAGVDDDPDLPAPHPLTADGRAVYERYVPLLREQGEVVRQRGALAVGQLHHAGAGDHGHSLRPASSASAVADEYCRQIPHPLTLDELADLVQVYAEAASRVQRAGLDAVEIHAAHGYLLQQFLSPLTNQRTDQYGGPLENRLRLTLEVFHAVRDAISDQLPVGVRIPGSESAVGGLTNHDMCEIARRLVDAGAAYLSVSNGNYTGLRRGLGVAYVAPRYVPSGPSVSDAAAIRRAAAIPVIVTGRLVEPEETDRMIADGVTDLVGVTRALIADPRLFAKARTGTEDRADRCIACNECHTGLPVRCTVNPAAGHEAELTPEPASRPRHVVVVGGGPAGMQCARIAGGRGHRVTLVEQAPALGGALGALAADHNRPELATFASHLQAEVVRAGVDVRLETAATPSLLAELAPDDVVVAVGADETVPPVPGVTRRQVTTALAALKGGEVAEGHVAVIGGLEDHLVPLIVADFLADTGRDVTLVTELPAEGEGLEPATRFELIRRLRDKGVRLVRLSALAGVTADGLVLRDVLTNAQRELDGIDGVVLACGRQPRTDLVQQLQASGLGYAIHLVGDCLAPRRLLHAMADATRVAVAL